MTTVAIDTDVASAILKARLPDHLSRLIAGRRLAITFVTVGDLTQRAHLHRWDDARRAGLHARRDPSSSTTSSPPCSPRRADTSKGLSAACRCAAHVPAGRAGLGDDRGAP